MKSKFLKSKSALRSTQEEEARQKGLISSPLDCRVLRLRGTFCVYTRYALTEFENINERL